jgi:hypothetical protein
MEQAIVRRFPNIIHIFTVVKWLFRTMQILQLSRNAYHIERKLLQCRLVNSFLHVLLLGTTSVYLHFQLCTLPTMPINQRILIPLT